MIHITKINDIGRGGFAKVELVEDAEHNRYAKKIFCPSYTVEFSAYEKLRKRFIREVKIQSQIGGNEIIPILYSDLNGESPFFLMPVAEKTYQQQIREDKASGKVSIDSIADILNAIEYLHILGFVHRDLNPRNILFHDSHWKLSDLGAILPPSGKTVTLTDDTAIITEQYCAPEQRNDFHNSRASADIYSFGCILHDIFGSGARTPYAKHTAAGPIGHIIEKCTDPKPDKRPSIKNLRSLVLEILVEMGGECKITDHASEVWLTRLSDIDKWNDEDFENFGRFFSDLNVKETDPNHAGGWVFSLSTPFLTKIPEAALGKISKRQDGNSVAIIEKYCDWAAETRFLFHFSDTVCARLCSIFDNGDTDCKGMSIIALIKLGYGHNRFHIMREFLNRCGPDRLTSDLDKRLAIEIRAADLQEKLKYCLEKVKWSASSVSENIRKCLQLDSE